MNVVAENIKAMKPFRFLLLVAALITLRNFALPQEYPYVIDSYDVMLDLHEDGTMDVKETIAVTFNETRHGIFRFIPVDYDTGKGITRSIFVSGISVTDENGNAQTTKIEGEGANVKIRVGEKDVLLLPGTRKTYVIGYHVENMVNWFENTTDWEPHAELYWNLTGVEWDTEIRRCTFKVTFPKAEGGKGLRVRMFYGPYGARYLDTLLQPAGGFFGKETGTALTLTDHDLTGERQEAMPPYSGLTMVLDVPSGVIHKPSTAQLIRWTLLPNLGFTIPIWVLLGMLVVWLKYGRDPQQGPMVVQFDPPDGMSGPEIGTLIDERVDQRDIAAGIISLAVKGYLRLHPKEEGLIFKKRSADLSLTDKPAGDDLTDFEMLLYAKLKACDLEGFIDESELRTKVAPQIGELRQALYQTLVKRGYYHQNPESARIGWMVGGIAFVIVLFAISMVISTVPNPLPGIVGGIVGVILVVLFSKGMPKRTHVGAKARDLARGFEEFIRRARGQELEWMAEKHPDQAMFEAFLPHAIAFGLVREWAQAFEGIVKEMPRWYGAPPGTPFNTMWFASDLGTITQSVGSAASVPPRSSGASGGSSGFGGGGFSGGGFGGGGGGSW